MTVPLPGDGRAFPPRSGNLAVPRAPRLATRMGLSLYDPATRIQRMGAAAARAAAGLGLGRLLPRANPPAEPPAAWWRSWIVEEVVPVLGEVRADAAHVSPGRVRCLLLRQDGSPLAFAKAEPAADAAALHRELALHALLARSATEPFDVPAVLHSAEHHGWTFALFAAIDGPHRPMPGDPDRVAAVIDSLQAALGDLPRPSEAEPSLRPGHGDFTSRNVRVDRRDRVWVIDWEDAGWTPRLADEVRFWAAVVALRPPWVSEARAVARVTRHLLRRGSPSEVADALRWPEFNTPAEASARAGIADEIRGRSG